VTADSLVTLQDGLGVVGSLLGVVQDEVGDLNVVLGRFDVEHTVPGGEVDGHSDVLASHGRSSANEGGRGRNS
jgi:hypothetical protein